MTPPKEPKERGTAMTLKTMAIALGNDLANAPHYLAIGRQFSDEDLPILMKHLAQAMEQAREEGIGEGYEKRKAELIRFAQNEAQIKILESFQKGFSAAREQAAKIAKAQGCYHNIGACGPQIAEDIKAMTMPEAEGGKRD